MKKSSLLKVTIVSLLTASLVAPNVASAAQYDVWNGTTKVGNLFDAVLNDNKALLLDIDENAGKYRYELGGKTYLFSDANNIAIANPYLDPTALENKIKLDLANQAIDSPDTSDLESVVTIVDPNLEKAIRALPEIPDTGEILKKDALKVTELHVYYREFGQVKDLTGLEAFKNLTYLR